LRKIQVFADMIVEKFSGDWNNTERFLKKIITSADRMRRLITSLLEYSRLPENDHFELADMNVIIANVMQDFELAIKAKKAKIHIDKIPPFEVIPCQIRQVFHNLLSNALKFTRAGVPPEINIKAELVREKSIDAEVDAQGHYCRITFSDNGIGFDEMYTEKVFEIFQRLNQREDYEGTGIGLAIVKKVLDRHEGIITATSQVDKGTTFVMVLPVNQH
jgi:signal transduction histidine kinase